MWQSICSESQVATNYWGYREGNGTPLQYSCLENPMDGEAWWAVVHGVAEGRTWLSDFTFTFHFSLSCIGEGNGNPLQCSCLENPRDGGVCGDAIYGVAQSRTQLKWLSSSSRVKLLRLFKWVKVTQSCPTLCNPMECIVHGILQARIPEWVAFPFSMGSSQPRDLTQVYLLDKKKKKKRINESLGVWCKHILFWNRSTKFILPCLNCHGLSYCHQVKPNVLP